MHGYLDIVPLVEHTRLSKQTSIKSVILIQQVCDRICILVCVWREGGREKDREGLSTHVKEREG